MASGCCRSYDLPLLWSFTTSGNTHNTVMFVGWGFQVTKHTYFLSVVAIEKEEKIISKAGI